jgi:DNA ligase-1
MALYALGVWSRGEELITARFPEIAEIGNRLPEGTVIDGEILAWSERRPFPFAELQKRIGRKTVGAKLLQTVPVTLIAFDVLEFEGEDVRANPLSDRLQILDRLKTTGLVEVPMPKTVNDWSELAAVRDQARDLRVEGLMLKRKSSVYGVGRKRGDWLKWKLDPFTIDAVLIYAQRGSGKRASLYTDYTFAVWNDERQLVPVAKAYSGLTDAEIKEVDAFVRKNTQDKFGPVRTVTPMLVMELAFEGIQKSSRHKSGIAVRFPRIARWRHDKGPDDANTLAEIKSLILD